MQCYCPLVVTAGVFFYLLVKEWKSPPSNIITPAMGIVSIGDSAVAMSLVILFGL